MSSRSGGPSARLLVLGSLAMLACHPGLVPAQQAPPEIKRAPSTAAQSAEARRRATGTATSGKATDAITQAARDAAKDNPEKVPEGGPDGSSKIGSTRVRTNPELADGSKTSREDALSAGSSLASGRPTATLSPDVNARPAFDQGFGARRTQVPAGAAGGGNPMTALTGGGGISGPLADSASRSSGVNGIASQGRGAISDGLTTPGVSCDQANGCTQTDPAKKAAKALEDATGLDGEKVADYMTTGGDKDRKSQMDSALNDNGSDPAPTPPVAKEDPPAKQDPPVKEDKVTKYDLIDKSGKKVGERLVHERIDGSSTQIDKRFTSGKTTITDTDASGKKTKQILEGEPDEESRYRKDKDDYVREKMADRNFQIVQDAKAGSTVNPDRNDNGGGRVAGAVAPSSSTTGQRLFGNPGQRGGMGESGAGRTGIDFNGNAGAIDPGDGATVTAGGRQQDPGSFFDRGRGPSQGLGDRPKPKEDEDEEKDQEKDKNKG